MSTNYAKSFKVKDEILLTIEHFKGVNKDSIGRINNYLDEVGYFSKGKCEGYDSNAALARKNFSKWLGFTYNSSSTGSITDANYCIRRSKFKSGDSDAGHPRSAHYQVVVFFLAMLICSSIVNLYEKPEANWFLQEPFSIGLVLFIIDGIFITIKGLIILLIKKVKGK